MKAVPTPTSDFEAVFGALQQAGVRYLVVGGVAAVMHGYPRFTADPKFDEKSAPDRMQNGTASMGSSSYD